MIPRKCRTISVRLVLIFLIYLTASTLSSKVFAVHAKCSYPTSKLNTNIKVNSYADESYFSQHIQSEDDIQYFAFLNIDKADKTLKPLILMARRELIFRSSWVADGTHGRIYNADGTLREELPQFHDLFPEDWEIPVQPVTIDLSYYGLSE